MTKRAEVIAYSITRQSERTVVAVTVECPNGCRDRRSVDTHHHGWTALGPDGGERAPHCGVSGAPAYRIVWTGGPPADVIAALEQEAARCP